MAGRGEREPGRADYARAYRLEKGPLRPGTLALAAFALTGLAVAGVLARQETPVFRPGPVSDAHAAAIGEASCMACHAPFGGPVDEGCTSSCHAHTDKPIHQPTQASTPPCGDCHFEHRGLDRLTRVADGQCVTCHGDLTVRPGAEPSVARAVHTFGGDHPDFVLPTDDSTLAFDHAAHLAPRKPLVDAAGREVALQCGDCHVAEAGAGGLDGTMQPLDFERHCQSCHLLTYDPGLPDEQVPHGELGAVRSYLLTAFAYGKGWRELSFEERRRVGVRTRRDRLTTGELRAATEAEGYLVQAQCTLCHRLEPGPVMPEVAPVTVSRDRLPAGAFPHDRHGAPQGFACTDCHDAETSGETADVLLPGIDTCRRCHGDEGVTTAGRKVPSACTDCHDYHQPDHAASVAAAGGRSNGSAFPAPTRR